MFDSVIIGAGVAGCVAARDLAESGRKVLVLEQRDHIGGNCYDEKDEHGILIHKYGPHIFHTKEQKAYDYLSRFTDWYAFGHEVVANVHGKLIPVPFNLNTLHMVYEQEKAAHLAGAMAANTTLPVIGIPIKSSTLDGLDALLSTVQMPGGLPVATVAIDGAENAALLAIQILAVEDATLAEKLDNARKEAAEKVLAKNKALEEKYAK